MLSRSHPLSSQPQNFTLDITQDASFYLPSLYFFRAVTGVDKRDDIDCYRHASTDYHSNRESPSIYWVHY